MQPMQQFNPYQYQAGQAPVFSYPGYQPPQTWMPQQQTQPQQQRVSQGPRVVGSESDITPQEVPMDGTTAYFPLADGSAVIGKAWAPDGTIKTVRFVPQQEPTKPETPSFEQVVLDRLASIEDMLSKPQRTTRRKVSDDAES